MKIAFVLTQSLDSPSGLGRYGPLARELSRMGHSVELFALHPAWDTLAQKQFYEAGVHVHYVAQMHVRKSGSHKQYFSPAQLLRVSLQATLKLAQALRHSQAQIIQLGKAQPFNVLAARLGSRQRPIFCDCDDYEAETNQFSGQWQKSIVRYFEDSIIGLARGLTVNTRFAQARYAALGFPAERIIYVPNGVERSRFGQVGDAAALRQQWHLTSHEELVLYVGTLGRKSHPVDLLLEAFQILSQSRPQTRLMLVGGGEDFVTLQEAAHTLGIGEKVIFCGRVPPETIPTYLSLATVTVDPVYDDLVARARSPLKLFESLAMGIPIVTADVGDRRTLLADGLVGHLVAPGNPQALAEGLLTILTNPLLHQQMTVNALRQREHWYWDRLVQEFVQVYQWAG